MIPTETVFSYPKALPIVMTGSPTIRSDEVPIAMAGRGEVGSTLISARSMTGSTWSTRAG